jgi:hypothetical protein
MASLLLFNQRIESIFQLLGNKENHLSYSVGYSLANCSGYLQKFLEHLKINLPADSPPVVVHLQKHESEKGFTDFEITCDGLFHIIIEAKRGWIFPDEDQLTKYVNRTGFKDSAAPIKRLVVVNESTPAFALTHFPYSAIEGVPTEIVSWRNLQQLADASHMKGRYLENNILKQISYYLAKNSTMQEKDSNWVYVVSLSGDLIPGTATTWQQLVVQHNKYFHPVGGGKGGWPHEPPNYIAFRHKGKLQAIHHIDSYEVFTNPSTHFPEIPSQTWQNQYLYHLGPAMRPAHEVRTGSGIVRSLRVWAMLDLLLTSSTIEEAWNLSKQR